MTLPLNQDDNSDHEYSVEEILDEGVAESGVRIYKIRWRNYTEDYDTWEPVNHLISCPKVLRKYLISHPDTVSDETVLKFSEIISQSPDVIDDPIQSSPDESQQFPSSRIQQSTNMTNQTVAPPNTEPLQNPSNYVEYEKEDSDIEFIPIKIKINDETSETINKTKKESPKKKKSTNETKTTNCSNQKFREKVQIEHDQ